MPPKSLLAGLVLAIAICVPARAAGLHQVGMMRMPVPSEQFSTGFIDDTTGLYFIPDRTNKAVDVFDLETEGFMLRIPGFTGDTGAPGSYGPNGIAATGASEIWVSDGDSSVKIVDMKTHQIVDIVRTGGKARVNEIAYDQKDKVLIAENSDDTPPFLTLISTTPGHKIIGKIPMAMAATNLERIIYYPSTDRFYVDVPAIVGQIDHGGLAEVDPKSAKLIALHPVNDCNPHGLSAAAGTLLFVGCGVNAKENPHPALHAVLYDTKNNAVTTYIPGIAGAGETASNLTAGYYYIAANNDPRGPALGVIDAKTNTLIERMPTWVGSHSVAVNLKNNHVYLPTRASSGPCGGCILIFAPE